ncbi:MAG: hypothetical protein BWY71_01245 [Planctomycetes bacterium ADurb.Bin412]|nr:MAG: hypothetical protein BWY71_01245 [Planctomycetes bacterium ADurb.Bin412]
MIDIAVGIFHPDDKFLRPSQINRHRNRRLAALDDRRTVKFFGIRIGFTGFLQGEDDGADPVGLIVHTEGRAEGLGRGGQANQELMGGMAKEAAGVRFSCQCQFFLFAGLILLGEVPPVGAMLENDQFIAPGFFLQEGVIEFGGNPGIFSIHFLRGGSDRSGNGNCKKNCKTTKGKDFCGHVRISCFWHQFLPPAFTMAVVPK